MWVVEHLWIFIQCIFMHWHRWRLQSLKAIHIDYSIVNMNLCYSFIWILPETITDDSTTIPMNPHDLPQTVISIHQLHEVQPAWRTMHRYIVWESTVWGIYCLWTGMMKQYYCILHKWLTMQTLFWMQTSLGRLMTALRSKSSWREQMYVFALPALHFSAFGEL